MNDYIKRKDAIEQIQAWATNLGNPRMLVKEDVIIVLENIPSVNVEDAISRKALLQKMYSRKDSLLLAWNNDYPTMSSEDRARLDEIIKCLIEIVAAPSVQSSKPKGEWIPCSERLPEDYEHVLVTTTYPHTHPVFVDWCVNGYWANHANNVLAWMPLPESYKESEDDE